MLELLSVAVLVVHLLLFEVVAVVPHLHAAVYGRTVLCVYVETVEQCRPLSKTKTWRLVEVVEKAR